MKIPATVEKIVNHGRNTYSLTIRPNKRVPRFKPGQFTHLALDPFDPTTFWPDSRVFSIANSPGRRERIRLTYTVVGSFTRRMERELAPGKEVWLKFPYGEFVIRADDQREIVLVAGGTGFTPFASFLEHVLDEKLELPIRLLYGAANPDLLVFSDLVKEVAAADTGFRYRLFLENGGLEGVQKGRIPFNEVMSIADDPENAVYYLSGPKIMVDTFLEKLVSCGVDRDLVRIDAWE